MRRVPWYWLIVAAGVGAFAGWLSHNHRAMQLAWAAAMLLEERAALILTIRDTEPQLVDDKPAGMPMLVRALMIAHDDIDLIQRLIESGENVNGRMATENNDGLGMTPLMTAGEFSRDPRIIDLLVKSGADVNAVDWAGDTAAVWAATAMNNPERAAVLRALIRNGADITTRNAKGKTALGAAKASGLRDTIAVLKESGARE